MDKIKTENYYRALNNENLCFCNYCRNYYKGVKETYPELSDYLARMGIDIEKPLETMPLEPYEAMGNATNFKNENIEGVHICIADSHPTTDIDEEHYVIEIYPLRLKWTV